ncbi:hypothetical protein POH93_23380 [Phytobacter diazotrophicus]|uniref:hypothetical protein n=1 Tax=Phytobacter diazotrophicus TaxID=395631 RepID=UPI00233003A3|nr:hypothetical protein [Phytobacter diazotrophicus]MDC0728312.1 hypothetical protein [Phytobacter diazotrophicus]MDC0735509.1 hypothetical protein [Phytobacter diazotrophicus]
MKLEVAKILNENFPVLHWLLINRFECTSIEVAVWNGARTDSAVEYRAGYLGWAAYGRMSKASFTAMESKLMGAFKNHVQQEAKR